MVEEKESRVSRYSFWEEGGNFLTHALACALIVWSLVLSDNHLYHLLSFSVALTFFFSTLYHGAGLLNLKRSIVNRFRRMDVLSIYVTIMMTGITWGMAANTSPYIIMGILVPMVSIFYWASKHYGTYEFEDRHTALTVVSSLMTAAIFYLGDWSTAQLIYFTGGLALYATGTFVYVMRDREWAHTIWHCFSSLAAALHLYGLNSIS